MMLRISRRQIVPVLAGFVAALTVGPAPILAEGLSGTGGPSHGLALGHEKKYGPDFTHFDYVNPDAPKGGSVTFAALGSFDSLNPFIIKGSPGAGSSSIYDTLMSSPQDEIFAQYGLLAETVEVPDDNSWVQYVLREEARFHDGHPIRAEDVIWTFNSLKEKGRPFYRYYYGNVEQVVEVDERTVRFDFKPGHNAELALILGQLPVLPKHYWETRDFEKTTLEPPLGSAAYRIASVDAGRAVVMERVEDYWGADLPVNKGRDNYDRIRYEYYRDPTVALEAFKAGNIDIRSENTAKFWATAYDIPAVEDGRIIKQKFPHSRSAGMQAYVMNTRKPLFQDVRVREAIINAWDYEWVNNNITYGAYTRTQSYFANSELASTGLPQDEELEILESLRGRIPDQVFSEPFSLPETDGSGNNRENLRKAYELLQEAGWVVKDKKLVNAETGELFRFEIMLRGEALVPHTQPLVRSLKRLGIEANIRTVEDAQYESRLENYDFDMIVSGWGQSLSPGNEQRDYWGSDTVERPGGRNLIGVQDDAIDELIELIISAPNRSSLVQRTRALDRVLLWNQFVIPMFHIDADRIVYWNRFGMPEDIPFKGVDTSAWWIDPEKDAALQQKGRK